jgi:hypothetical protein
MKSRSAIGLSGTYARTSSKELTDGRLVPLFGGIGKSGEFRGTG